MHRPEATVAQAQVGEFWIPRRAEFLHEGFDVDAAVVITDFKGKGLFRVREKRPIIVELSGESAKCAKEFFTKLRTSEVKSAGPAGWWQRRWRWRAR